MKESTYLILFHISFSLLLRNCHWNCKKLLQFSLQYFVFIGKMIKLLEKLTFICKIFTKKWGFHFHYSWNFLFKIFLCLEIWNLVKLLVAPEAVVQRCSVNELLKACNFVKKETLAQVFSCEFCEISKNTFFHETPLVGASIGHAAWLFYYVSRACSKWTIMLMGDLLKVNNKKTSWLSSTFLYC